ncbi:MAG TPA: c-type cytochrome biogenesis protein CcmI [Stellaceae bacterium]|nr:c-type cytochrome biogenesis protein CcmI [Stellaceae bacterium]
MILFWGAAGLLTVAALAVLLWPLLRTPRPGAAVEEPIATLYRRQLAAIDVELAQGRLTSEQAAAGRAEVTRRLLAATATGAPAETAENESVRATSWRMGAAVGIAALLPVAAIAVYFAVGTPAAIDPGAIAEAAIPHGEAELAAAAARIEAHLQQAPGDLRGWILLARTDASLSRFPEARAAYARAIALAPGRIGLHAELGEVLVLAADGTVTPAAAAEFAKAPDDPRSRYYAAEAAAQRGDAAGARQKLQALLASAPAAAPWRQAVAERLAELSPSAPVSADATPGSTAPGPTAPGPTAQDIAAARSLSPEQREAMIRGMVESLAQRLERNPGDKAGWARLAHAYDVLREPGKAAAARAREAAADTGTASAPAVSPAAAPIATTPTGTAGAAPR